MLSVFDLIAVLLVLMAAFAWINRRLIRLPHMIGLRPATMLDELKAVGVEAILSGQRGIYDITVSCGEEVTAVFRGHARAVDERIG